MSNLTFQVHCIQPELLGICGPTDGTVQCVNKGPTNFTLFPVVDSNAFGALDIDSVTWQIKQVWVQLDGGTTWEQVALPDSDTLISPTYFQKYGGGPLPLSYPFISTPLVSREYVSWWTNAFSISQLSQLFYGAVSMQSLGVAASADTEFALGVNPRVTNFVIVYLRLNGPLTAGESHMYMNIKDNSFNPVMANAGTAFIFDMTTAEPVGTPADAGFYAGYDFGSATAYQDNLASIDRDSLFVCNKTCPVDAQLSI